MERSGHSLLEQPIGTLAGVGPSVASKLARLGVRTLADFVCLLPQRYEDRTQVVPLGALGPGQKALIEGEVALAEVAFRRRRSLLCRLVDGTGSITLRFFHFHAAQQRTLQRGVRLRCFGEVRAGPTGLEMVHPEYRVIAGDEAAPGTTLTPVYPATGGLSQQRLRQIAEQVLAVLERSPPPDYLADQLAGRSPGFGESIRSLHRPPQSADGALLAAGTHPWQRRLALEELVAQRLSLRRSSLAARAERAPILADSAGLLDTLERSLPFRLTGAQRLAIEAVARDLAAGVPMNRLLQGDVGSGKTVVAAAAALVAASAGHQTAVMAPTELLAEQHFATFARWLDPLGIGLVYLSGSQTATARSGAIGALSTGRAAIAVGTHALFQEAVRFQRLGLVIVDEQHRFGVAQRLKLKSKGDDGTFVPHQLIMTATPIPRTLAMTAYADLDCTVIDELPAGREPIRTVVMPEDKRPKLVERVAAHGKTGQQTYWVCPLIEESEASESSAASELAVELAAALPGLAVGLVHGRMKAADKDAVMRRFKSGAIDVLVATTVIEVGVDVPNATLMIIENAERMGLAQLHQLRGRVGRGLAASTCVLLYKPPLSAIAAERLRVLRSTGSGFDVAEKDLALRGPGEVLGTRQTGLPELRVASLVRDADLLPEVVAISERLLEHHPERIEALIRRWVRGTTEYAKV